MDSNTRTLLAAAIIAGSAILAAVIISGSWKPGTAASAGSVPGEEHQQLIRALESLRTAVEQHGPQRGPTLQASGARGPEAAPGAPRTPQARESEAPAAIGSESHNAAVDPVMLSTMLAASERSMLAERKFDVIWHILRSIEEPRADHPARAPYERILSLVQGATSLDALREVLMQYRRAFRSGDLTPFIDDNR